MKATVVRPSELSAAELDRWRGIQRANPTLRNPFPSPDFSLAIDRARPTARVAVLEDGGHIVGFFPHELRGRCIGKPIGAGISDCQGFIHTADFDWDAMQLVRACRLPVWEFDHLIAGQHPFSAYHCTLHAFPIMNLINGFPAYTAERQQMSKIIKDSERLGEDGRTRCRVIRVGTGKAGEITTSRSDGYRMFRAHLAKSSRYGANPVRMRHKVLRWCGPWGGR